MFTRKWLRDATERAIATGAQALVAVIGPTTLFDVDWRWAASTVGGAVLGSVLKSVIGTQIGDPETASWNR